MDVQASLDEWLEGNPEAQKYVTKLYYIAPGSQVPLDVTHINRLTSRTSGERTLVVGIVCKPEFAVFLDMLLSIIATQPPVKP